MSDRTPTSTPPLDPPQIPSPRGLANPYFHIVLGALLVAASELFLRKGAATSLSAPLSGWWSWSGLGALASGWVWLAIGCYIASFLCWIHVLRFVPLIIAFNLINLVHVFVPLGSWIWLHETISPLRGCGIGLVLLGVWTIAKPLVFLEERI